MVLRPAGLPGAKGGLMPGKERLQEIVNQEAHAAITSAGQIVQSAVYPKDATEATVTEHAGRAHAAIDRAAEAARILVREGE